MRLARHHTTGALVAMKSLDKKKLEPNLITSEVGILKTLQHPSIVRLLEVMETQNAVHIIMEYMSAGDLRDYMCSGEDTKIPEEEARRLFSELTRGVQYCHQRGIIHSDLKPENVLVDKQGHVKISDFGLAFRCLPGEEVTTVGGTYLYTAPEVFLDEMYQGPPLDIWALGVILYEMVAGYPPFLGPEEYTIEHIVAGDYCPSDSFSPDLEDLVKKLLNPSPSERLTIDQVMHHPWLQGAPSPRSPPAALSRDTKSMILRIMKDMGHDVLKVIESTRLLKYDHEMATYLLLQDQALQGLGFTIRVKPADSDEAAGAEAPSSLEDPAPSFLRRRRASEPAISTGPFLPEVKASGHRTARSSLLPTVICKRAPPRVAWPSSPAPPSVACRPGPEAPSSSPTSVPPRNRRRPWKAVKKRLLGCLQALCCCFCLPASKIPRDDHGPTMVVPL